MALGWTGTSTVITVDGKGAEEDVLLVWDQLWKNLTALPSLHSSKVQLRPIKHCMTAKLQTKGKKSSNLPWRYKCAQTKDKQTTLHSTQSSPRLPPFSYWISHLLPSSATVTMKHTGMLLKKGCWVVGENTATRGGQEDQGQPPSWQSLWRNMQVRFFLKMFLISYFYLKNKNKKRHQT